MTLQDLGSLGDVLAAVATVIALVYLAVQIRQGAQVVRSTQSQEFVHWRTELLEPVIGDRDTTALWLKGGEDFAELDPVDQRRLIFFEWRAISGWNHYYHMHEKGLLDDHQWSELTFLIQRIGRRQAMKAAWREYRDGYDEGFRTFIDGYLG
ncbi:MAG: hypothetical protein LJF04_03640 [Gemmatimonadetes bacterium]|nr:hypothetical protein [Gemmatimonadota bacterium]